MRRPKRREHRRHGYRLAGYRTRSGGDLDFNFGFLGTAAGGVPFNALIHPTTATQVDLTGSILATGQAFILADFTGLATATSAVLGFSTDVDSNGSTADNGQLLAAAVPEPWMMMVGGFELSGTAVRRRRAWLRSLDLRFQLQSADIMRDRYLQGLLLNAGPTKNFSSASV